MSWPSVEHILALTLVRKECCMSMLEKWEGYELPRPYTLEPLYRLQQPLVAMAQAGYDADALQFLL